MRQSNYNLFYTLTPGNPAILGAAPVDWWLCVPPFWGGLPLSDGGECPENPSIQAFVGKMLTPVSD